MLTRFRTSISILIVSLIALIVNTGVGYAGGSVATYAVTIENLSDGQPLTPPIVATHRKPVHLFRIGEPATVAIKEIAENGNGMPMLENLAAEKHVSSFLQTDGGPLVPDDTPGAEMFGDSVTFAITAGKGSKYLSFASMLICTNDGFTGVDGVRLPKKVGDVMEVYADGYDAGTEINTEDFADIVPPCQGLIGITSDDPGTGMSNPDLAEGGVITHHAGIQGGVDLVPDVHGWSDPVVMVTIERVD